MIWANGFQFWASRLLISRLTFQHLSLLPLSLNLRLDIFYLLSQPSGPVNLQQFKKNVCSYCIILFSIVFPIWLVLSQHTFHIPFTQVSRLVASALLCSLAWKSLAKLLTKRSKSLVFSAIFRFFSSESSQTSQLGQHELSLFKRFQKNEAVLCPLMLLDWRSRTPFSSLIPANPQNSRQNATGFLPQKISQAKSASPRADFAPDFAPMSPGPSLPAVLRCFRPSCPLLPWPSQAPDSPPGIEAMAMVRTGTGPPHSNSIIRWKKTYEKTWENLRKMIFSNEVSAGLNSGPYPSATNEEYEWRICARIIWIASDDSQNTLSDTMTTLPQCGCIIVSVD